MESKYSIINNCGWIFSIILLFYLFKKNIKLGLIASLIILFINFKYNFESFEDTQNLPIDKLIDSIDVNKLNFETIYIPVDIDKKTYDITKKALKDKKLKKIIENKMIEIYNQIKNNGKLKMYLKFMNLINEDDMPSFINEWEETLLYNKIKIILITLPKL
jgi:hypothetical protein